MKRRDLLKLGLLSPFASLLSGWSKLAQAFHIPTPSPSPVPTPFQKPLPIPPVLTPTANPLYPGADYYEITMQPVQLSVYPGLPATTFWAYNGMVPGPTIKAVTGRPVYVKQTNALGSVRHRDLSAVNTTVHLHGGRVADVDDGHPDDIFAPGTSKVYYYPNIQEHSNLWYHDHAVYYTGENVYMGLAGFYILQDDHELGLNLPSGDYDVPLVIQDKLFRSNGALRYPALNQNSVQSGFLGDTILVNGAIQPYFQVANRKYRFRILNGSNGRQYTLALSLNSNPTILTNEPMIQIGTDGGLLTEKISRTSMLIGQAERLDIVIDFSAYPVGTQVYLHNTFKHFDDTTRTGRIMRFDVVRSESDPSVIPATLRTITPLTNPVVTRPFQLAFDGTNWTINGQIYHSNIINFSPRLNDVELWTFQNNSPNPHPMHPHLAMFQVNDSAGRPCWKDTINVPNGSASFLVKFTDFRGVYVFHCHNLEHEDHDMMLQFETT